MQWHLKKTYKRSKREDMRINMLKVFSREVLLYSFIKTLQMISELFAFHTKKALNKMHVMLSISSAMKAKLGVGFNCQNFLSGYRIHGWRFIKSHLLHCTVCSAGKQRCFSVSNPQRSGSQVKPYHPMCPTSTLQTNVVFQMLLKACSSRSWCYRDRGSSIIWLVLFLLSVMMHEIKRALESLGSFYLGKLKVFSWKVGKCSKYSVGN